MKGNGLTEKDRDHSKGAGSCALRILLSQNFRAPAAIFGAHGELDLTLCDLACINQFNRVALILGRDPEGNGISLNFPVLDFDGVVQQPADGAGQGGIGGFEIVSQVQYGTVGDREGGFPFACNVGRESGGGQKEEYADSRECAFHA